MGEISRQKEHLNLDNMNMRVIALKGGMARLATLPALIGALNKKL